MSPRGVATGSGVYQESGTVPFKIPDYDPRSGDHFWVMGLLYKVDPEKLAAGEQGILDTENLVSMQGPGCYYCEQVYTPLLAKRRCNGDPGKNLQAFLQ